VDGYTGSNDILKKLKYANLGSPTVDLYWGDVRVLLEESELEIARLRAALIMARIAVSHACEDSGRLLYTQDLARIDAALGEKE
jgi:hypothetical protein